MLEQTDSNTDRVYVRLLGEGTTVYRPAPGVLKGSGIALLIEPQDYDSDDENWEFKPGTTVRVEERTLGGQKVLVAVAVAE